MVSGAERQLQKIDGQGWQLLFWCRMASDPESLKSKLIKGLQRHIFSKLERFVRMATSSSRPGHARSSFPLSIYFFFLLIILSANA